MTPRQIAVTILAACLLVQVWSGHAFAFPEETTTKAKETPLLPSSAQVSDTTGTATTTEDGPPFWDLPGRASQGIKTWLSELVASALHPVFDLIARTVLSTPRVDHHPRISELWRFSLTLTDAALLLLTLAGAGIVMVGGGLAFQLSAKEVLARLLVAAATSNLSLILLGQMISISNALSLAFIGAGTGSDAEEVGRKITELAFSTLQGNPFFIILLLAVVLLGVLVLASYVVRVAVITLLAAAAPLLLLGHSLPQTEGLAKAWWRVIIALLAAPIAQSVLLAVSFRVFLSSDGLLGFPSGEGLIDLLVIGVLFYLMFKLPFIALNFAFGSVGSAAWSKGKQKASAGIKAIKAAKAAAV